MMVKHWISLSHFIARPRRQILSYKYWALRRMKCCFLMITLWNKRCANWYNLTLNVVVTITFENLSHSTFLLPCVCVCMGKSTISRENWMGTLINKCLVFLLSSISLILLNFKWRYWIKVTILLLLAFSIFLICFIIRVRCWCNIIAYWNIIRKLSKRWLFLMCGRVILCCIASLLRDSSSDFIRWLNYL